MNATSFNAILAEAGSQALWRTNPVLCIDRLLARWDRSDASWVASGARLANLIEALREQGIPLPVAAIDRWIAKGHNLAAARSAASTEPPKPRVIGLAVRGKPETGYVFPLRPDCSDGRWSIDAQLPFSPEDVLDVLAQLVNVSGIAEQRGVPERLAFRFENPTQLRAHGDSMTVAAVLAVLDCMSGNSLTVLRAAVSLVQVGPGGALESVGEIRTKLAAAKRECGELSLVVCAPGTEIDHGMVTVVWEVNSLAGLAGFLHAAGLLDPLLDAAGPLSRSEATRVLERLRWLIEREHRYREAADLGDRVRRCEFAAPVDPAITTEFARLYAGACRHHGRFLDAVTVGEEAYQRIAALGALASDDEEADAAAEHAADLFIGHRFAEITPLLRPWAAAAASEPRRFRSLTRVKVWNTLGRGLAVIGEQDWDELFGRSLALHRQQADPDNIERTIHYRAHARLRNGDVTGARQALADAPPLKDRSKHVPWAAFLHANLARLEARVWADSAVEERLAAGEQPYAAWLYLQATARQAARSRDDALRRLERAISLLQHEAGGVHGNICNLFVAFLRLVAAGRTEQIEQWNAAITDVRSFLLSAPDHRAYYGPAFQMLPIVPDAAAAETLLNLVPYF